MTMDGVVVKIEVQEDDFYGDFAREHDNVQLKRQSAENNHPITESDGYQTMTDDESCSKSDNLKSNHNQNKETKEETPIEQQRRSSRIKLKKKQISKQGKIVKRKKLKKCKIKKISLESDKQNTARSETKKEANGKDLEQIPAKSGTKKEDKKDSEQIIAKSGTKKAGKKDPEQIPAKSGTKKAGKKDPEQIPAKSGTKKDDKKDPEQIPAKSGTKKEDKKDPEQIQAKSGTEENAISRKDLSTDQNQIEENNRTEIQARILRERIKLPIESDSDGEEDIVPDDSKLKIDGSYDPDSDEQYDLEAENICSICEKEFKQKRYLTRHMLIAHQIKKEFTCKVCQKVLKNERERDRHYNTHEHHLCDKCGKVFKKSANLLGHVRTMHEDHSYKCEYEGCTKVFSNTANRHRHVNAIHLNLRKYVCDTCPSIFKTSSALRSHVYSFHTEVECKKKYTCKICRKVFYSKTHMKLHEKIHSDNKPFICDYDGCGKGFRDKCSMRKHELVHSDEKPYQCDVCGERFSRRVYLIQHQYKHTGVKMYQCTVCSKSFCQNGNLKVHMALHSDKRVTYKCAKCDRSFHHKSNYTKHMLSHDNPDVKLSKRRKRHKAQKMLKREEVKEEEEEEWEKMETEEIANDLEDLEEIKVDVMDKGTSTMDTTRAVVVCGSGDIIVNDADLINTDIVEKVVTRVQEEENSNAAEEQAENIHVGEETETKGAGDEIVIELRDNSPESQEIVKALDLSSMQLVTNSEITESIKKSVTSIAVGEVAEIGTKPVEQEPISTFIPEPVTTVIERTVTTDPQESVETIVLQPFPKIMQETENINQIADVTDGESTLESRETIVFVGGDIGSHTVDAEMLREFLDKHGVNTVEVIPDENVADS